MDEEKSLNRYMWAGQRGRNSPLTVLLGQFPGCHWERLDQYIGPISHIAFEFNFSDVAIWNPLPLLAGYDVVLINTTQVV